MNDNAKANKQVHELQHLQQVLHEKNIALDALHYVWCDGGCEHGTHRYTEKNITEEVVLAAENNTRRLRTWWENKKLKDSYICVNCGGSGHIMCTR